MRKIALWFLILFFWAGMVNAATYYMATNGSDSNDGSTGSRWATFDHAFTTMDGGDTLIIGDGTYTESLDDPPNGSAGSYTIIKAENDFAVTVSVWDAIRLVSDSYIQVEGIKFKGSSGGTASTLEFQGSHHVKMLRCAFTDAGSTENVTAVSVTNSCSYILFEDCWAWGTGRYKFKTQSSDYCIFRRCVSRHDYHVSSQCAPFTRYDSDHVYFQNCIAIDSGLSNDSTGTMYAGFWNENNNSTDEENGGNYGCIALNLKGSIVSGHNDPKLVGTRTIENCVYWDCLFGMHTGDYNSGQPGSQGIFNISNVTIGNNVGSNMWRGIWNEYNYRSIDVNVDNSIIVNNSTGIYNQPAAADVDVDYIHRYGNSTDYYQVSAGANDITSNPFSAILLYLPRVESGANGATILKKIGTSGTLYGETGWNTATSDDLWPWPYEDEIRDDMAAYNQFGVSGARGFCANIAHSETPNGLISLSTYIWEYLGNSIPESIYSNEPPTPDTTAPSDVSDLAASTGSSVGQVNLSWTAPGDDGSDTGTVSGYTIKYNTVAITSGNFDGSATATTQSYTKVSATNTQNVVVTGLTPGQTYYFAVKAYDEIPNTSGVSNSPSAVAKIATPITDELAFVTSGKSAGLQTSSVSVTFDVPNNTEYPNRRAIISVFAEEVYSANYTLSSVTGNGTAAALVDTETATSGSNTMHVEVWEMDDSDFSTDDESVTFTATAGGNCDDLIMIVELFYNANQDALANVESTTETAGGTSVEDSITTAYDNSFIIGAVGDGQPSTATVNVGTIEEKDGIGSSTGAMSYYDLTTAGAQTITYSNMSVYRKSMILVELPEEGGTPDTTPPTAVADLSVVQGTGGAGRINVTFTAPADATTIDVRYSESNITTETWATDTQATGDAESMTITGLTASTLYYVGVKTKDAYDNESDLSNIDSATSSADPAPVPGSGSVVTGGGLSGCSLR